MKKNLRKLKSLDLQKWAITNENWAKIEYRIELERRIAKASKTKQIILFDDKLPMQHYEEAAKHSAAPYERAITRGLIHSAGFPEGGTVLVSILPTLVEWQKAINDKSSLEDKLGKQIQFRLAYEDIVSGEFYSNLLALTQKDYLDLCERLAIFFQNTSRVQKLSGTRLIDVFINNSNKLLKASSPSYVIPYEVGNFHYQKLSKLIKRGRVVLPDMPIMDKARNTFLLKSYNIHSVPHLIAVSNSGKHIEKLIDYQSTLTTTYPYQLVYKDKRIIHTKPLLNYVKGILQAIDLVRNKNGSYLKIDSSGVSGYSNVDPEVYPDVYNLNLNIEKRINALILFLEEKEFTSIPNISVVEEFIDCKKIKYSDAKAQYGVGGQVVNGIPYITYIAPCVDLNGIYMGHSIGAKASLLNESKNEYIRFAKEVLDAVNIIARNGYKNGRFALDIMLDNTDKVYIHDYNLRRSGVTQGESEITLRPKEGFFESIVSIPLSELNLDKKHNVDLWKFYDTLTSIIVAKGCIVYATNFGIYSKSIDTLKFKVIVPYSNQELAINKVRHSKRLSYIKSFVIGEARRELQRLGW